MEYNAVFG